MEAGRYPPRNHDPRRQGRQASLHASGSHGALRSGREFLQQDGKRQRQEWFLCLLNTDEGLGPHRFVERLFQDRRGNLPQVAEDRRCQAEQAEDQQQPDPGECERRCDRTRDDKVILAHGAARLRPYGQGRNDLEKRSRHIQGIRRLQLRQSLVAFRQERA